MERRRTDPHAVESARVSGPHAEAGEPASIRPGLAWDEDDLPAAVITDAFRFHPENREEVQRRLQFLPGAEIHACVPKGAACFLLTRPGRRADSVVCSGVLWPGKLVVSSETREDADAVRAELEATLGGLVQLEERSTAEPEPED